jgi:DNA invertase Pin-like site-specific DNA recombinase
MPACACPPARARPVRVHACERNSGGRRGVRAGRDKLAPRQAAARWRGFKEFTEVESGRRRSRPELAKALAYCKAHRAKLVVARLDRLTRNTRFLLDLVDSRVEPLFCDLPMVPALWARLSSP